MSSHARDDTMAPVVLSLVFQRRDNTRDARRPSLRVDAQRIESIQSNGSGLDPFVVSDDVDRTRLKPDLGNLIGENAVHGYRYVGANED